MPHIYQLLIYKAHSNQTPIQHTTGQYTQLFQPQIHLLTVVHVEKCTLFVAEKPDAAARIAEALDVSGKPKRRLHKGVPYFEAFREGKLVIVSALGHLYTVAGTKKGPFDYQWVPRYRVERKATRTRVWLQAISELAKDANEFVDACDYDIEGSIIGYCILRYTCGSKENVAKRMKYSTLTAEELKNAYTHVLEGLDFGLVESGLTRHEVDWLYGINLSRTLTAAAKKHSGTYTTLSTGRVQGPTLKFLAERENAIANFKPTPYWTLKAKIKTDNKTYIAEHENKTFENHQTAQAAFEAANQKTANVEEVENKPFRLNAPFPFDLGTLQLEAYRLFKYTPMRTLSIAQKLYVEALISYPRTSSQKLPASIGYEKILQGLTKNHKYFALAGELLSKPKLIPMEGKKQDSAHPAIFPTGNQPRKPLSALEEKVYDLVAHRFLACFAPPALGETSTVHLRIGEERFVLSGRRIEERGWLGFYEPFGEVKETILPLLSVGDVVRVLGVILDEKATLPPARYDAASLLRKMEHENIGTKATRAGIMQTLYDRKYIEGQKMTVTALGAQVTEVLSQYCPSVVSVEFTRELEEEMERVSQGKETKQNVIAQAIENLKTALGALEKNEAAVGEKLSQTVKTARLEEKIVGACPHCHSGKLMIVYSKKTGKRFVGCTNYFLGTCTATFALPQKGFLKPSGKQCQKCGCPTVLVWLAPRRVWELCLNEACPRRRKRKTTAPKEET
jgi:DNA topoisomerase-1